MNRYRLRFSKTGVLIYVSHLDVMRIFSQSFRRAGIDLRYSEGFNPHPRLSFAQPLALGCVGLSEYLDFELDRQAEPSELIARLNGQLPAGLRILACQSMAEGQSRSAAAVRWADYELRIERAGALITAKADAEASPGAPDSATDAESLLRAPDPVSEENAAIERFLAQTAIPATKAASPSKRRGKPTEIDIRPLIADFRRLPCADEARYFAKLATGSAAHLSIDLLLSAYFQFRDSPFDKQAVRCIRREMYDEAFQPLL